MKIPLCGRAAGNYFGSMKYLLAAAMCIFLSSCNTAIGVYRDVKAGVVWTAGKIKGAGASSGGGYDSGSADGGAPIY